MKPTTSPGCRLRVLLARDAPIGVIFRRGPSRWVQIIRWNTKTDEFERGQWFHGHIYVGRSDLSPDGSLLLYFCQKINKRTLSDPNYTYSWTAISKPPYLTALALWPKGNCWHGGGLFEGQHDVFLNHKPEVAIPHPNHLPKGVRVRPNPDAFGEDDPIEIPRMQRGGWKHVQWLDYDYHKWRTKQPAISEKQLRNGKVVLRVEKYYDPEEQLLCYLVKPNSHRIEIGVGSWVDVDQQGRLAFAADGRLFAGKLTKGKVVLDQLADFNDSKPANLESPAWARRW